MLAEYPLPGYGYGVTTPSEGYVETVGSSQLYRDWQLTFFAVPDAAQYFIQGRERQMLEWYFYHGSYSGNSVISYDMLLLYTRAIEKPGFLRSGMMYFAAAFQDELFFTQAFNHSKLQMPVLAMGGEASFSPESLLRAAFEPVAANLTTAVIPKAGHWIVRLTLL